ncbi:uncharacterized protein I206_105630 [Kwoniella pini CBS 10737]|uniref:Uncharacterized protein n=1 Tax=Kwoniella pini CBS 10737 TaxID=1296096 RepID=A0A1B9I3U6_9TREE|nr:uncharacterized protein I206_03470 [Kwoniella pini CBS 10737]OCF50151.1 hypothetical protein I206_03470 [Kwoniella pini CBS 10737]
MYPYYQPPESIEHPLQTQPHVYLPHPPNQNFYLPPLPPYSAQRFTSQPPSTETQGHARRPSQLNPEASLFSFEFRPVGGVSSMDDGYGRLKRHHDDPSALGIDYGDTGETLERRVSPRKQALKKPIESIPPHQSQSHGFESRYPTSLPREYDFPPQLPSQPSSDTRSNVPITSAPTLHIQRESQHYGTDRAMLGISSSAHISPQASVPTSHTRDQYHKYAVPPPFNRAWTLHSGLTTSLSPHRPTTQGLPLTDSSLPHPHSQGRISPPRSVFSAPYDNRSPTSERRLISLSPSLGRKRANSPFEGERKYRGYRAKEGGPPKAVLGGPGGKTFDERLALKSTATSPNLSPQKGPTDTATPLRNTIGVYTTSEKASEEKYTYRGKLIEVKLPPTSYSPPDSPPKAPLPDSNFDKVEQDEREMTMVVERRPRKEAFPWPESKMRLSPPGIPLPLSPELPGKDTLKRPSIDWPVIENTGDVHVWRGKEVQVTLPDQDCWERLRPPMPSAAELDTEIDTDDEENGKTEAEISAVLQPDTPTSQAGKDNTSVNTVEDAIHLSDNETQEDSLAWDECLISPVQDRSMREKIEHSSGNTFFESTLIPHPTLPPRPITREDSIAYDPISEISSPTKRSCSGKDLGNADFVKRQLGALLKDTDAKTTGHATSHNREVSIGSTISGKRSDQDSVQEPDQQRETFDINDGATPVLVSKSVASKKSKMRAWSDDEDDSAIEDDRLNEDDSRPSGEDSLSESVSSPARLEDVENQSIHHNTAQPAQERQAEIAHAPRTAVQTSSKMRAWTLEENEVDVHEGRGISGPARIPSSSHNHSQKTDRWKNDRLGTADFEDVPLIVTEVSQAKSMESTESNGRLDSSSLGTPIRVPSSTDEISELGIREARLSFETEHPRHSDIRHTREGSQSTSSSSSERPPRDDRSPIKREVENSYLPSDTPTLPLAEPIVSLKEITIYPSNPIQLPPTLRPNAEAPPDVPAPQSITTSTGSADPEVQPPTHVHSTRCSPSIPLSPVPARDVITSSPAKIEEYATPPQSTGDTFASAAYMTADGSPLIPTRTFVDTSPQPLRGLLPDLSSWREPVPTILEMPYAGQSSDASEELDDSYEAKAEDGLVCPKPYIERQRERGFSRSAAPSPPSERQVENPVNETEPSPDPMVVNTKFRHWIFPLQAGDSDQGHKARPSITRRHTMPLGDYLDELENLHSTENNGLGVASTFASRVGELRTYFRADEEMSRGNSAEFPFRKQKRVLGVVNIDNIDKKSPLATPTSNGNEADGQNTRLDEILHLLRKGSGKDRDMKDGIVEALQAFLAQSHLPLTHNGTFETIKPILEKHSRLLTSIHELANLPSTRLPVSADSPEERDQTRNKELFAAILTGQHAILSKFEEVASSQSTGSATISQAIEALQNAQNAAEQRHLEQESQSKIIMALREEIDHKVISITEYRAQMDVLNQRLNDTRCDKTELRDQMQGLMTRMEEMTLKSSKMENELNGVLARALAADFERDALASSLKEEKDIQDSLRSELKEYQQQLEKEHRNHQAKLAEKQVEFDSMQSAIHTQLSEIKEQRQAIKTLQETISTHEREQVAETEKRHVAQESALIEFSQNALTHQEEIMARLNKLDENMYESMGSKVKEYETVLDRNRTLQSEVDSLRERLAASADRFAKLQLTTTDTVSANTAIQLAISDKLTDETKRKEEAESKMEEMRKELEKVKEEKINWHLVATERQAMARMQEIQLQALCQENVYWKQFALDADRRRFKDFMETKPFRNEDGSEFVNIDGKTKEENQGTC